MSIENGAMVAGIAAGSRVITRRGEIPVEDLVAGEEILTALGRFSHVRLIEFATPPAAPVRVLKDALGPMQPHQDVLLAAGQVVHTDAGPVAAASLLNGKTVVQDWQTHPRMVRLEVETREPILVEGMPLQ